MTDKEYEQLSMKMEQYRNLGILIDQLKHEKDKVEKGALGITASYNYYIDFTHAYDGFHNNLQKVLIQFYDDEIDRLKKLQEDIKV